MHNSSLFHSFLQHKLKNTVSFSILMPMNHDNDEPNCVKTVNNGEKRKLNIKMHRVLIFFCHCVERWLFIHLQNIIKTSSFWNFACNTAIAWPRTLLSYQPLLQIIQWIFKDKVSFNYHTPFPICSPLRRRSRGYKNPKYT